MVWAGSLDSGSGVGRIISRLLRVVSVQQYHTLLCMPRPNMASYSYARVDTYIVGLSAIILCERIVGSSS